MTQPQDYDGLLDWAKLQDWIIAQPGVPGSGPVLEATQLTGGSQNALFLLKRQDGAAVLRRPPRHPRANGNATMLREARLLKAIAGSGVPHPELYAVCEDVAVTGVAFYLMAPLEGFSPGGALPGAYGTDPAWRRAMGEELVDAAAALGKVDHVAAGLADFGKAENWHARQVDRWRSQLEGYRELPGYDGHELPHVDEIGRWLSDNVPTDGRIGIIHGDYQFPNVMFSHLAPKISGLIDWELGTLGDPLLDLGWTLTAWREAGDPTVGSSAPQVQPWDGFLSRAELVSRYGAASGRDMSTMPWFFGLACFKLACLLEGSYARAKAGQASMKMGEMLHQYALWLLAKAMQIKATA